MADGFTSKRKQGLAQAHGSGYGGTGYKFDENEEDKRKAERKVWEHMLLVLVGRLYGLVRTCWGWQQSSGF